MEASGNFKTALAKASDQLPKMLKADQVQLVISYLMIENENMRGRTVELQGNLEKSQRQIERLKSNLAAAEAQGEKFILAVEKLQGGNVKEAKTDLSALAKAEQPGYRAMAQILLANVTAAEGNSKKAVADYAKVAGDDSLPQPFRDLALVRQTAAEFDSLAPQQVIDRMKPLAKPGAAWFGTAGEMTAIAYMKMGKDNLAGPIFAQIAKQEDLPQTLRARAQQMAGALGVDTVQLEVKPTGASATTDADKGN